MVLSVPFSTAQPLVGKASRSKPRHWSADLPSKRVSHLPEPLFVVDVVEVEQPLIKKAQADRRSKIRMRIRLIECPVCNVCHGSWSSDTNSDHWVAGSGILSPRRIYCQMASIC